MKVDLHIHTNCSDGLYSPSEIIQRAAEEGVTILSFTDHNCFADDYSSLIEQAKKLNLYLIKGIEISSRFHNIELHILGYNLGQPCSALEEYLEYYQKEKTIQTQLRCQESLNDPLRLASGKQISLPFEEIQQRAPNNKKVYLWNEMIYLLAQKFNQDKRDQDPSMSFHQAKALLIGLPSAYEQFKEAIPSLKRGKTLWPVHHKIQYHSTEDIIHWIKESQGLSSLAHPGEQAPGLKEDLIAELKRISPLDALEVYSPKNKNIMFYRQIAQKLGLLFSGGTDFHFADDYNRLGMVLNKRTPQPPTSNDCLILTKEKITLLSKLQPF